ncbi:MerR family transcriptional regulator [Nocardioides sp. Leaf285]|uniref:MerR family transcriptional regulator n=1 Tax=Nocardioides sp. Leaf285 TaxID=1736322 RepID=UPI000702B710|nr:MerR family transcriptional regulator [Nocardioides sp. Leaf285]KQP63661.1 hypothetical protein ASF47_16720 [Nocardioides sp. Leaf285]
MDGPAGRSGTADPPRLMSIGDFARASGLTPKALRLYDDSGLLDPAEVDPHTGYRWYAEQQLPRARLVARLRLVGMPLARIRVVAGLGPAAAVAELVSYGRQLSADTASARALLASLVDELGHAPDEETPMSTDDPRPTPDGSTDRSTDRGGPGGPALPGPKLRCAARLEQGGRATQEDAVLVGTRLVAVADGVGSASGSGERAVAALAAAERDGLLDGLLDGRLDGAAALGAVETVLARAAAALAPGDATTLTALALHAGQLVVAHVGDSRAHLVREGRLTRLTRDHTVVQTLVDEGRLTTEEARSDERRVQLNRALESGRPAEPDLAVHAVRPGDRLVLTTDGVHGRVGPAVLADLLAGGGDPQQVADAVVAAVEAAGADDNLAVVVVDVA